MKRTVLITGILLMLIIAGNNSLNAQQNIKADRDTTRMERQGRMMRHDNMQGRMPAFNRGMRYGMRDEQFNRRGMGPYGMRNGFGPAGDHRGMRPYGMRDGMRGGQADRWRPYGPGIMRIESILTLTDKQKEEIETLRQKQIAEMKKVRDEMSEKMQVMRENNRKAVLELLTDEQKKQLEQAR
jgi:hypothetical protein